MNATPIKFTTFDVNDAGLPPANVERVAERIGPKIADRLERVAGRMMGLVSEVIYAVIDQGNAGTDDVAGATEPERDEHLVDAIRFIESQLPDSVSQWKVPTPDSPPQPTPEPSEGDVDVNVDESGTES